MRQQTDRLTDPDRTRPCLASTAVIALTRGVTVNRLAVLQHAINRTETVADVYEVDPAAVEISGTDILTAPFRDGWTVGALQRILLDIADDHAGCDLEGCGTCSAIRDGLAVSLNGLRNLQREQLEASVRQASSGPWWRRGGGGRPRRG